MNIRYLSNINAKYFEILEFQNLLELKGFLDAQLRPTCKIDGQTPTFCSNFVLEQEKPQQPS
jgi:hypothetical protein